MTVPDLVTTIDLGFDPVRAGTLGGRPAKGVARPSVHADGHLWRAVRTSEGEATLRLTARGGSVDVRAWGPGAASAADLVPDSLGAADDPGRLEAADPVIADLQRRFGQRRLGATHDLWPALVPTILGQKVPTVAAERSWREVVNAFGTEPPGPAPDELRLIPSAERLGQLAYHDFHRFGVERKRAAIIIVAAHTIATHPEWSQLDPSTARRRLESIPGIGAWTSSIVVLEALGDPDSVIVGDYKLPGQVAWALMGERGADDDRMLELLEPYRGQRARVQTLIASAGMRPPRRGPRLAAIDIRHR